MNKLVETDKAYLAGILDGEGCIGYYNANPDPEGTPYCHADINITNTHKGVVDWVQQVTGLGRSKPTNKFTVQGRMKAYQWQIAKKQDVREFLEAIDPYLRIKADQSHVLLNLFDQEKDYVRKQGSVSPAVAALRMETVAKLKALKRAA
jgi:hypothetical protein